MKKCTCTNIRGSTARTITIPASKSSSSARSSTQCTKYLIPAQQVEEHPILQEQLPEELEEPETRNNDEEYYHYTVPRSRNSLQGVYSNMACSFVAMITPMKTVKATHSQNDGHIEFTIRRTNGITTLQWEPFTGIVSVNGATAMVVNQSTPGLPAYPVEYLIGIQHNGIFKLTTLEVNPHVNDRIRIYFNADKSGLDVNANDSVVVPGGVVSWICPE